MPDLSFSCVVSCSSESKDFPASNLLKGKKWKSARPGESQVAVVLALAEAEQIHAVDIGNEASAFVELQVGRAADVDKFHVLLPTASFMTPQDSRELRNSVNKVRMFSQDKFDAKVAAQKWDRLKIVCTQPFNRSTTYGLSFVSVHSPPTVTLLPAVSSGNAVARLTLKRTETVDDDAPVFKPGAMFRHDVPAPVPKQDAASPSSVRQAASSLVLKYANETPKERREAEKNNTTAEQWPDAHDAIGGPATPQRGKGGGVSRRVIGGQAGSSAKKEGSSAKKEGSSAKKEGSSAKKEGSSAKKEGSSAKKEGSSAKKEGSSVKTNGGDGSIRKRPSSQDTPNSSNQQGIACSTPKAARLEGSSATGQPETKPIRKVAFGKLLDGCVVVLSGFVNPTRGELRDAAVAMGARYKPAWCPEATHLVCAFKNTPKYEEARRAKGRVVRKEWLMACERERRKLHWKDFLLNPTDGDAFPDDDVTLSANDGDVTAAEPGGRGSVPHGTPARERPAPSVDAVGDGDDVYDLDTDNEEDTDEEIERHKREKLQRSSVGE